jgi:hypothetical protein
MAQIHPSIYKQNHRKPHQARPLFKPSGCSLAFEQSNLCGLAINEKNCFKENITSLDSPLQMKRLGFFGILKHQNHPMDRATFAESLEQSPPWKALPRKWDPLRIQSPLASIICLVLLTSAFLCTSPQARCDTVIETLTGTTTQGTDWTGVFIGKNADMTGFPFKVVYTLDTNGGILYGNQSACDNGRINSALNTPIPKAVVTVKGKSYTLGLLPPTSINTWVISASATSPKTVANIWLGLNYPYTYPSTAIYGNDYCGAWISLNSIPDNIECRNWAEEFSYKLKPPVDVSMGQLAIQHYKPPQGVYEDAVAYFNVETINVSGPIKPAETPHIFFLNSSTGKYIDVTNATVPISVVVGEPIELVAVPGATPANPQAWVVPGNPIGAYLLKPQAASSSCVPPTGPVPPCAQLTNPAAGCAEVVAPDLSKDSITFYWTTPGTYDLKYDYTSGSVSTKFLVKGPTDLIVKSVATGPVQIVNSNVYYGVFEADTAFPITHGGITSLATTVQPVPGQFQWVQLITAD